MSRHLAPARDAVLSDAPVLAALWADNMRRGSQDDHLSDCRVAIENATSTKGERLVVIEWDGEVAGAAYLRATTVSPINLEPVVHVVSPHVFERFKRHGVGTALIEAGVQFAEELGVGHVGVAASAGSRDANRFMARLALAPMAMLRVAPTASVRARVGSTRAALTRQPANSGRQIDRILAARRLRRRDQVAG